jgi:transcriptional regulator with XRE-family HTH domain
LLESEAHTPINQLADPSVLLRAGKRVTAFRILHSVLHGRRKQPMTQVELARKAGVSVGCLQAFEGGIRVTRPDNIRRIAEACDMTVDALFADDAPPATAADEFTDETLDVARMFELAHAELKIEIKKLLVAHLSQRTDKRATTYMGRRSREGGQPSTGAGAPFSVARNGA